MRHPLFFLTIWLAAASSSTFGATALFDFEQVGSPTQAGWTSAPRGNGSDGVVSVSTSATGTAAVDTRNRGSDSGGGAEAPMWNDFVFGSGSFTDGGAPTNNGLLVTIVGLQPSTEYPITIWGYDVASGTNNRVTEWSGGGGSAVLSFFGNAGSNPASLADHAVSFNAITDPSGGLVLAGTPASGGAPPPFSHNVFINGLEIGDPIPEPSGWLLSALAVGLLTTRRHR